MVKHPLHITLKQVITQGNLDDFISQHPQEPVSRDLEERFEQVLDSMVKGRPSDDTG